MAAGSGRYGKYNSKLAAIRCRAIGVRSIDARGRLGLEKTLVEDEADQILNELKFIDYVGEILQAYVDRREQVRLIKELYGNQIGELYHSLSFDLVEFVMDDSDCKVTVSLRYIDLVSVLPTRIRVLAWPLHCSKKMISSLSSTNRRGTGAAIPQSTPTPLSYAEDALRTMSLPEAYAEIVLNLPKALQQIFPHLDKSTSEKSVGVATT